jgi:hypothetical protein
VRAAVLDGEDLAAAVDDADLEVLPFDETLLARGQLFDGADVDQWTHVRPNPIPEVWILSTAGLAAGEVARVADRGAPAAVDLAA